LQDVGVYVKGEEEIPSLSPLPPPLIPRGAPPFPFTHNAKKSYNLWNIIPEKHSDEETKLKK